MNVDPQPYEKSFLSQPLTKEDAVHYRKRVDEMTRILLDLALKLKESGREIESYRPEPPNSSNIRTHSHLFAYLISLRLNCNHAIDSALRAGLISFEQGTEYLHAVNESAAPSRFAH